MKESLRVPEHILTLSLADNLFCLLLLSHRNLADTGIRTRSTRTPVDVSQGWGSGVDSFFYQIPAKRYDYILQVILPFR